jgi:hypothetical protein
MKAGFGLVFGVIRPFLEGFRKTEEEASLKTSILQDYVVCQLTLHLTPVICVAPRIENSRNDQLRKRLNFLVKLLCSSLGRFLLLRCLKSGDIRPRRECLSRVCCRAK